LAGRGAPFTRLAANASKFSTGDKGLAIKRATLSIRHWLGTGHNDEEAARTEKQTGA